MPFLKANRRGSIAVKPCIQCGRELRNRAKFCTECGVPQPAQRSLRWVVLGAVSLGLVAVCSILILPLLSSAWPRKPGQDVDPAQPGPGRQVPTPNDSVLQSNRQQPPLTPRDLLASPLPRTLPGQPRQSEQGSPTEYTRDTIQGLLSQAFHPIGQNKLGLFEALTGPEAKERRLQALKDLGKLRGELIKQYNIEMYPFLIDDDLEIRTQAEASLREFYEQGNESIHWPADDNGFFIWIENWPVRDLSSADASRRLGAIEALGYLGHHAKAALPKLEAMYKDKVLTDSPTRKALKTAIDAIRGGPP